MTRFDLLVLGCLLACGGGDKGGTDGGVVMDGDNSSDAIDAPPPIDAPAMTFPAVCQELPLRCPDASSLADCEAGSAAAFGTCSYLPITFGCASAGCPSEAQICRTAEMAEGYCTHSCVEDANCTVDGGGSATCQTINGVVKICIVN